MGETDEASREPRTPDPVAGLIPPPRPAEPGSRLQSRPEPAPEPEPAPTPDPVDEGLSFTWSLVGALIGCALFVGALWAALYFLA